MSMFAGSDPFQRAAELGGQDEAYARIPMVGDQDNWDQDGALRTNHECQTDAQGMRAEHARAYPVLIPTTNDERLGNKQIWRMVANSDPFLCAAELRERGAHAHFRTPAFVNLRIYAFTPARPPV